MQGIKKEIVFPKQVYDFLKDLCKKMAVTPLINPMTGQYAEDPQTKKQLTMSKTGTFEEFVHVSILQGFIPLISNNPAFAAEQLKMQEILQVYGEFIQKTLGPGPNQNATQKKSK